LSVPLESVSMNVIVCSLDDLPCVIFTFIAESPLDVTTAEVASMITWPPNRTIGSPGSETPPTRASATQRRVLKPNGVGVCAPGDWIGGIWVGFWPRTCADATDIADRDKINTGLASPQDIVHWEAAPPALSSAIRAEPWSVIVLFAEL
jgi:hypothetical protein